MNPPEESPESVPDARHLPRRARKARASWTSFWRRYWRRAGGGSLTISIAIHVFLLVAALLIFFQQNPPPPEDRPFLPGGGGGGKSSSADRIAKQRATPMNLPRTRLASAATNSTITLPDLQNSITDLSALTRPMMAGGGMGGGEGGLKGKGKGSRFGDGIGSGIGNGVGRGFVSVPKLFGMDIDAKRIAVVLDVSGSMHEFLTTVVREVDKVAPGAPIVLNYGCGMNPGGSKRKGEKKSRAEPVSGGKLDKDRIGEELRTSNEAGLTALYEKLKSRPATFFIPDSDQGTVGEALTDMKVGEADALYWFADFADFLDKDKLREVGIAMRGRRQKLYIHPSNPDWLKKGSTYEENVRLVDEMLVKPSGGKILNVDLTKVTAK